MDDESVFTIDAQWPVLLVMNDFRCCFVPTVLSFQGWGMLVIEALPHNQTARFDSASGLPSRIFASVP
jgi:hypothetical protein